MLLLIDQHTGSVTYIETIHGDSFFFKIADAVEFLIFHFATKTIFIIFLRFFSCEICKKKNVEYLFLDFDDLCIFISWINYAGLNN